MKKLIVTVLMLAMVFVFAACGSPAGNTEKGAEGSKLQVVTTIFPEYDWVKNVLGDEAENVDLTVLLDNGVDLHSYQPTAEDIMKNSNCDMFIYAGGESDDWVDDALEEASNKDMVVINLLHELGASAKVEEIKEGMEAEDEHDHDHDADVDDHNEDMDEDHHEDGEDHHDGEEPEYDEHVWLSLKNAQLFVTKIQESLSGLNPEKADVFKANAEAYLTQLKDLDTKYQEAVSGAANKVLLFGDRFPFRYLVDDYGLDYYAAFVGCSAETEASFETITFLANKTDELGLKNVMIIDSSDGKIAQTIIDNTAAKNQSILILDSMQSTTSEDATAGVTYLSTMEKNLDVLKEALA